MAKTISRVVAAKELGVSMRTIDRMRKSDHMPKGGIMVNVTFPTARARFKPLRVVLPRWPTTILQGTEDTPEYRIEGRTLGGNVIIYVDIRKPAPTIAALRIAWRVRCL